MQDGIFLMNIINEDCTPTSPQSKFQCPRYSHVLVPINVDHDAKNVSTEMQKILKYIFIYPLSNQLQRTLRMGLFLD